MADLKARRRPRCLRLCHRLKGRGEERPAGRVGAWVGAGRTGWTGWTGWTPRALQLGPAGDPAGGRECKNRARVKWVKDKIGFFIHPFSVPSIHRLICFRSRKYYMGGTGVEKSGTGQKGKR